MDEVLFHRLYDQFHQDVFQFLIYLVKDRHVAEDLSHEVYVRAIKSYAQFQHQSSEKTWLFAIAKNVSIDYFRKQAVRNKRAITNFDWESEKLLSLEASPEQQIVQSEQLGAIYSLLDECTGDQKMVVVLRYIQQLSIQETAEILQWSESKVKTTQHRAIHKLRVLMENKVERGNEYV